MQRWQRMQSCYIQVIMHVCELATLSMIKTCRVTQVEGTVGELKQCVPGNYILRRAIVPGTQL